MFPIGRICWTRGICIAVAESDEFDLELLYATKMYLNKDWGDLCEEDKKTNEEALVYGN